MIIEASSVQGFMILGKGEANFFPAMPPPGSRDPPVLLIFIRGRWQSVPPGGRFAVARRGKLEELRSETVHRALRRFQMGLPSKARLGHRLSFKKIPLSDRENSDIEVTLIEPKQRNVRPHKRTRDSTSSEEAVQSVTTVATVHDAKRRITSYESKSSEDSRTDLKKSREKLIKPPKNLSETSRTDLINQKSKKNMKSPTKSSVSPKIGLSLRRKHVEQTNTSKQSSPILKSKDSSEKQISRYLPPRSGKQNQSPIKGKTVSDSDFEMDQREIIKSKTKQNQSPKKGETVLSDSDFETDQSDVIKSKTKQNQSPKKIKVISNSKLGTKNEKPSSNNQNKFHKIGPKRQKLDPDTSESESSNKAENIFQRSKPNGTPIIGTTKVLDIDEQDIELIRKFLQKHYSDKELLKFDEDDEYKRMIFYRINPLVNIELCPIIDRMLRGSQDSQITLTDFALNLGLRSVTEAASFKTQRYKIRKRTERSYLDNNSDSSSKEENNDVRPRRIEKAKILKEKVHNMRESSNIRDNKAKESKNKVSNKRVLTRKRAHSESEESNAKENINKAKERAKQKNRNTVESDSEATNTKKNNKKASNTKKQTKREPDSDTKKPTERKQSNPGENDCRESKAKRVHQIDIDNTVDTVELSSESEKEEAVKAVKKTAKSKPVISSKRRRTNLEYSTLEDHAIVAWVSTGSRASRVNGNLLWRQLQDQYTQITGSRRTWHSLRNRYLRYILPKLGDLALPFSQQTRLRAAAATGELKAQKARSPRRNSIFKLPPRGAASRRPAATNDDTEKDNKELPSKRPPSYSSLTRQFTRLHQTRPSSELSDNSLRSNKLEVTARKEPEAKGNTLRNPCSAKNSPLQQINVKATGNEHSDSDRRSESPRRDKDSSDSSSESEDESTNTNEPRITRRSAHDANMRMSRSDTRQNTRESKGSLTRQSNILDESDESKSRKTRGETNKRQSRQQKQTNEIPSRQVNRHKSPSEQTSRDSSESMSQSRRKSPENNRRRSGRHTKNRNESDNESKRRNSPKMSVSQSPTRKLNRNKSPSKQSSKGSTTSMRQVRGKSKSPMNHKNPRHDSSSAENESSNGSVNQPRRKSNRINSSKDQSTRPKSNRLISPRKQNGHLSSDLPRRGSNRLTPNESSNKRRHSSEPKRKSKLAKRDSLDEIVVSDSSESFETKKPTKDLKKKNDSPKKIVEKPKMRRLFNPKAVL